MGGVGAILQHDTKLTRTHCLAEYGNVQYPVTKAAGKQTQTMSVFVTEAKRDFGKCMTILLGALSSKVRE
jgi:hypothetical protein